MSLLPYFYRYCIDPMTGSIRRMILDWVPDNSRVLDIGSGTGTLCFHLAEHNRHITGIDNSADMIRYSERIKKKKPSDHLFFQYMDATKPLDFKDRSFHFTVLSMALHQVSFDEGLSIIREAVRVGESLIIADYSVPLPANFYGHLARLMERLAGGMHYRNFRSYYSNQGLTSLITKPNSRLIKTRPAGGGIFTIMHVTQKK